MAIPAVVWLVISVVFFAFGEYFSKIWAAKPNIGLAIVVVFTSVLSAFTWLPALLHRNEIAIMGTIWLLLATVAVIVVGVVFFQEKISLIEWIGIGLGLLALAFLGFYNPR